MWQFPKWNVFFFNEKKTSHGSNKTRLKVLTICCDKKCTVGFSLSLSLSPRVVINGTRSLFLLNFFCFQFVSISFSNCFWALLSVSCVVYILKLWNVWIWKMHEINFWMRENKLFYNFPMELPSHTHKLSNEFSRFMPIRGTAAHTSSNNNLLLTVIRWKKKLAFLMWFLSKNNNKIVSCHKLTLSKMAR